MTGDEKDLGVYRNNIILWYHLLPLGKYHGFESSTFSLNTGIQGNLEQLLGLCVFVFEFVCFLKSFLPSGIWMIVASILARR